ncbi:hypothetical protein BGZ75_006937 [Mortierella antarctica]|nr:hypothetical protein BGZ75_006937 [Mortierella antarctica]
MSTHAPARRQPPSPPPPDHPCSNSNPLASSTHPADPMNPSATATADNCTTSTTSTAADADYSKKPATVSDATLISPLISTKYQPQQSTLLSPGSALTYSRAAATAGSNSVNAQTTGTHLSDASVYYQAEPPTGTPRCIVRIDRDHQAGDETTRFECEQFPEEFLGRVTRPQFKGTVEGINECMRNAEESLLNCLDTLLDCLSAYTAKHCCGTHYQRAMRRMEALIDLENQRLYHPARMHLRDPQKVGMLYLEFEIF